MPDSVLAAIIAGTATLSASLLQLRTALLRDATRGQSASKRRGRVQLILLLIMIGASVVCGFAASQWLNSGARAAQETMQRELQARVAEISHTATQLELTRSGERSEIEAGVLRQLGTDGVVVTATVAPCHPTLSIGVPAASAPPGAQTTAGTSRACTEAEATPVTLCATIPGKAQVTEVELYSRPGDSDAPWSSNRFAAGQESGEARFAQEYSQTTPQAGTREVCQGFTHWSTEHARIVRVVVRYSL